MSEKEHDCSKTKNFEHYKMPNGEFEFDYDVDTVLFYGKCSICGKQLVERFDFADVVERRTGKRLSKIPDLDKLKLAYRKCVNTKNTDKAIEALEDFLKTCKELLS